MPMGIFQLVAQLWKIKIVCDQVENVDGNCVDGNCAVGVDVSRVFVYVAFDVLHFKNGNSPL